MTEPFFMRIDVEHILSSSKLGEGTSDWTQELEQRKSGCRSSLSKAYQQYREAIPIS